MPASNGSSSSSGRLAAGADAWSGVDGADMGSRSSSGRLPTGVDASPGVNGADVGSSSRASEGNSEASHRHTGEQSDR